MASFVMGMVWIYFFANVIVDLLVLFGIMTDVSASMLGLTVLSWGNSVGDAIASISISKRGLGEMAMTGCVAGPVFNLLLGLGLTLLWTHSGTEDGIEFKVEDEQSEATLFIIVASICTLSALVALTAANDYVVAKWHAKVLMGLYTFIVVGAVYICM
jgi:sodium/potassium/calcium exchanger 6